MAEINLDKPYFVADPEPVPHPERVAAALARTRQRLGDVRDARFPRISQTLLDHIESLTADFEQAQRCVLEEALETIEFIASMTKQSPEIWLACAEVIRRSLPPRPEDTLSEPVPRKRKPARKR
jgi:hypothetical protein